MGEREPLTRAHGRDAGDRAGFPYSQPIRNVASATASQ